MKGGKERNILEIIGIVLIIVAIVSSYGLYYTGNQYSKVVETQTTTFATITGLNATTEGNNVRVSIDGYIDNPSRLDIDITVIEVRLYLSDGEYNTAPRLATGGLNISVPSGESQTFTIYYNFDPILVNQFTDAHGNFYIISEGEANFMVSGVGEIYEASIGWNGQVVTLDG